jgi:type IV secretory pathway VirB2 component (pilin)
MNKIWVAIFLLLLCLMPTVLAIDFDEELSDEDQETFDGILEPVMKIYNFIKYAATVLAVLFLVFAGIIFVTSGNDQAKREQAKSMALYVVIGLVIIWIAPLVVEFLVG